MKVITTITTLTPTRMGMGQSIDIIDQPVHRDVATNWPILSGSGIKGVLRDLGRDQNKDEATLNRVFGSSDNAGSLVVTDLFPILFPVRSDYGVFSWVTCPLALTRTAELASIVGVKFLAGTWKPVFPSEGIPVAIIHQNDCAIEVKNAISLDELNLKPEKQNLESLAGSLAAITDLKATSILSQLAIVHDDVFTFLTEQGTELRTKTALDFGTKTAKQGSLRQEEYLPAYVIFVGYADLPSDYGLETEVLQVGAQASTGAGLVKWKATEGGEK